MYVYIYVYTYIYISMCVCACALYRQKSTHWCRFFLFFCFYTATQLALQVQQERSQVVWTNREAWKRPARGHSRNGPWTRRNTHTHEDTQKRNRIRHTSIDTQPELTTPTRNSSCFFIYFIFAVPGFTTT